MLVIADINHDLFGQASPTTQQKYVDYANDEVVDLGKQFGVDEANIATPWHLRLIRYGVCCALSEFAFDKAGFNNADGFTQEEDVYTDLYNKSMFKRQDAHNKISKVCFTGNDEDGNSRAVASVRLVRA